MQHMERRLVSTRGSAASDRTCRSPTRAGCSQAAQWLLEAEHPLICASRVGPRSVRGRATRRAGRDCWARTSWPIRYPHESCRATIRWPWRGGHRAHAARDADCLLVLDMLRAVGADRYKPGANVPHHHAGHRPDPSHDDHLRVPIDLAISGDAGRSIPLLLEELRSQMTADQQRRCEARPARCQRKVAARLRSAREAAETPNASKAACDGQLGSAIRSARPSIPRPIIVSELVNTSGFNRTRPGTQFNAGGSSLGWAAPAAIGVKVAAPDREVVACTGDGSWMFGNPQVVTWASAVPQGAGAVHRVQQPRLLDGHDADHAQLPRGLCRPRAPT